MAGVDALVPGISTVTRYARYYSLYWAVAYHVDDAGLDRRGCQQLIRRAEVALATISREHDALDGWPGLAHGVDRLARFTKNGGVNFAAAARIGPDSYSPRDWGFWSQYNGPSIALGTATVDGGALRAGRHACPPRVSSVGKRRNHCDLRHSGFEVHLFA